MANTELSCLEEPPETPAHLFVIKAFRSALFGTPAPSNYQQIPDEDPDQLKLAHHNQLDNKAGLTREGQVPPSENQLPNTQPEKEPEKEAVASPAKGILMTPGTGKTRRKTVSFGTLAVAEYQTPKLTETVANVPSLEISCIDMALVQTEAPVRKRLFESQVKTASETAKDNLQTSLSKAEHKQITSGQMINTMPSAFGFKLGSDVTTDLTNPQSKSGQHWKREYQRDHDKSKTEMRKLIRYSQLAKSYAVKRDCEAVHLRRKLEVAQLRVTEVENEISDMAIQLGNARNQVGMNGRLLEDLAAQTAEALVYKEKAARYKLALRDKPFLNVRAFPKDEPKIEENFPVAGESWEETRKFPTVSRFSQEVAQTANSRVADLERENASLKHTVSRVKEEMKKYEMRHHAWENNRKQREAKASARKRALKEELLCVKEENNRLNERLRLSDNINPSLSVRRELGEGTNVVRNACSSCQSVETEAPESTGQAIQVRGGFNTLRSESIPTNGNPTQRAIRYHKLEKDCEHVATGVLERKQYLPNQSIAHRPRSQDLLARNLSSSSVPHYSTEDWTSKLPQAHRRNSSDSRANADSCSPIARKQETLHSEAVQVCGKSTAVHVVADQRMLQQNCILTSQATSMSRRTPLPQDRAAAAKLRLKQRSTEKRVAEQQKRKVQISGKENMAPHLLV